MLNQNEIPFRAEKKYLVLAVCVAILAIGSYYWLSYTSPQKYAGPVEKITVGTTREFSTLLLLAKERGYFRENGIEVNTVEYSSGAPEFIDLLAGKIDMATAADFLGVRNAFTSDRFRVIATICKVTDGFELVARGDHGIRVPSDLKRKKIGVTRKTSGDFWLGTFLTFNNLKTEDITIVDLPPRELQAALLRGDIDAMMNSEPFVHQAKMELGGNAKAWSGQGDIASNNELYATTDLLKNHPAAVLRFMRALVEAEAFAANNRDVAMKFIATHFQYDSAYMQSIIPKFRFTVSLDQSLLLSMEEEARWMIENKLTDATTTPNYLNFIYFDALEKIKPEAVTITH